MLPLIASLLLRFPRLCPLFSDCTDFLFVWIAQHEKDCKMYGHGARCPCQLQAGGFTVSVTGEGIPWSLVPPPVACTKTPIPGTPGQGNDQGTRHHGLLHSSTCEALIREVGRLSLTLPGLVIYGNTMDPWAVPAM